MKVTNCYNCEGEAHSFYAEENGYILVKCSGCGLLYVIDPPDPSEISQAHKQGEHRGEKVFNITGKFAKAKIPRYIEIVESLFNHDFTTINSWIDVGCGHGEFMVAVKKVIGEQMDIIGSEPNVSKQESARGMGLNVSYIDLETHTKQYDVISLLNVYSHLPNPVSFIKSIKPLLKPGGSLIIQTGDTAGLNPEDHYRPFYLPDHLSFASEKILIGILERLDFEIVNIKKYPFVGRDFKTILKETIKMLLPKYKSKLAYVLEWNKYSQTDMYIRARLKIH